MKVAVHIAFYYLERRLPFLRQMLESVSAIPHDLDVFIHTNRELRLTSEAAHFNLCVVKHSVLEPPIPRAAYDVIPFRLRERLDPFLLTWKPRRQILEHLEDYDAQAYLEDDIGLTTEGFDYWLNYKDTCISRDYNLGFLRVETDHKTG
jgi:hypothetical protein